MTPFTSLDRFPGDSADAPVDRILVLKSPAPELAHLRFEWHPRTGKVYWLVPPSPEREAECLRRGERPAVTAEVLAEHCEDYGRAFGFVQTFCRGVRLVQNLTGGTHE